MEKLAFENETLTENSLKALSAYTDMIECQCPAKMIALLREVRAFRDYTHDCIARYPEDKAVHHWLESAAVNIDKLLSATLVQLARLEGYVTGEDSIQKPAAPAGRPAT